MNTRLRFLYCAFYVISCMGCGENKDVDTPPTEPDPIGTVAIDMHSSNERIDGVIFNDGGNFKGALFLPLGNVNGLGSIKTIPRNGWVEQVAIIEGHGYVAWKYGKYYRLFVAVKDGFQTLVKYQYPFYGENDSILPTEESFTFSNKAERKKLSFNNTCLFPFDVECSESWCNVVISSSNEKTPYDEILITVDPKASPGTRECVIEIKNEYGNSKEINVKQYGTDEWLEVSPSEMNLTGAATSVVIGIASNCEWEALSNYAWCKLGERTSRFLTLLIDENNSKNDRTAEITIATPNNKVVKKVRIKQTVPQLTVLTNNITNNNGYDEINEVIVNCDVYSWIAESDSSWCVVEKDENSIRIKATKNRTNQIRHATISVYLYGDKKAEIRVTQPITFVKGNWLESPEENYPGKYQYAYYMSPDYPDLRNYSVCYDIEKHCPRWVSYPLHECYKGDASRTNAYGYGPQIDQSIQADKIVSNSSYYRGLLIESGNRSLSKQINSQVFYYTNMIPMVYDGFANGGGIWNSWLNWRNQQICADTLYVVAGTYYENENTKETSANNLIVTIPTHYYQVLLRSKRGNTGKAVHLLGYSELQCVGFIVEHKSAPKVCPTRDALRSVAEIENLTGITYFPFVPNAPKNDFNPSDWDL